MRDIYTCEIWKFILKKRIKLDFKTAIAVQINRGMMILNLAII